MADIPRIVALVEWAKTEHRKSLQGMPSAWDQGAWIDSGVDVDDGIFIPHCGTAACVCGHMAIQDGAEITFIEGDPSFGGMRPEVYGAEALGITQVEANHLFHGSNTIADLERIRDELIEAYS